MFHNTDYSPCSSNMMANSWGGQYFKHMTIVNDDSSVIISEAPSLLTTLVVIYDRDNVIRQATGANVIKLFMVVSFEFS